jgi:hypothetical protein
MRFVSFIQAFAGKRSDQQQADLRRSLGIAGLEKDFDRTSDAFIDAARLLERCLPRSFGI